MDMRSIRLNGGGRRRRLFLLAFVLAVSALGAFMISNALAVHDLGVFQLDGDASSATNTAGTPAASDDWDKVCHQIAGSDCGTSSNTSGATAVAWSNDCNFGSTTCTATDPTATSDRSASTFAGGGSKDPLNINQWAWADGVGGLPDKDNLVHAYAARYNVTGTGGSTDCVSGQTCDVIYFGLDRFDNSGDAQTGFWFLQNKCTEGTNKVGGANGFTCTDPTPGTNPADDFHRNGDLLVLSDFSNGGTTSTINIYAWNTACTKAGQVLGNGNTCGDANLELLKGSTQANCGTPGLAGDDFCGIVNPKTITMPWSFTDKSGTPNNGALNGEFYEAGVNLTPLGLGGECFASLVSETRSSTSTSAVLKDFIAETFGGCTSSLSTTAQGPTGDGTIGTGSVSSGGDSATLTVKGAASWTGTMNFYLCGPIATGTCDSHGVLVDSQTVNQGTAQPIVSKAANLTSAGRYCWFGQFISGTPNVPNATDDGSGTSPNPECFNVGPVTPTLTTSASCSASPCVTGSTLSDTATLTGTASQPGTNGSGGDTGLYKSINANNGAAAGGSITWTAFGPNDCTTVAMAATSRDVSGNKTYPTASQSPVSFVAGQPGDYTFVASYTADSSGNTNGAGPTACPNKAGGETVTVTDTTSVASAQTWRPQDTGTVSSTHGSNLNGTLTIQLYDNSDCGVAESGAGAVSGQSYSKTLTNAGSPQSVTSNNTSFDVSMSKSVSWLVTFTSTDGNVGGSSHCESTSLTITN
jgi:hypothetical protein